MYPTAKSPYIVMSSAANMPSSCWGRYANVAVVECALSDDRQKFIEPKQIHPNHKAVARIVYYRGSLNIGKTERCAYRRTLRRAEKIAAKLNARYNQPQYALVVRAFHL